jgi:hypothetical protein
MSATATAATVDIERAYLDVIEDAITQHPRSQQKVIGPSEIGIECDKRVLYKLAGVAEPARPPAWKPAIGTAVHAQLEEWFDRANQINPATGEVTNYEWVTESRVYVGDIGTQKVFGSADLFHVPSGTVLDHKIVGTRQLQNYRSNGPSAQYRVQAHLYGLGFLKEAGWGMPREVMICFLPRDGELSKSYLWHEAWNPHIALKALNRANRLDQLWRMVGIDQAVAQSPGCTSPWCPWCRATSRTKEGGSLFDS